MREWLSDLDHRLLVKTVVFSALIAVVWWTGHSGVAVQSQRNCEAINQSNAVLEHYIEQQINRAVDSLPTIEYYKQHPVELGRQLRNLEEQRAATREAFAPRPC